MLTYTPFESKTCGLQGNPLEGTFGPVNVNQVERCASIAGGIALVVAGLSRRTFPGLLMAVVGGLFVARGLGGHCKLYQSIGVSTADTRSSGVPGHTGQKIEKTIQIVCPPAEVFRFWRNLENLSEFMENIESIRVLDDRRSHWIVRGPAGRLIEWDAEIVNEHPDEMISWQTLPGADVQSAGTVRFSPAEEGKSTLLRVVLEFHPPAGLVGTSLARLFKKDPNVQLDKDLIRLKHVLENRNATGVAG
jgi:uncharacterized membrane protein